MKRSCFAFITAAILLTSSVASSQTTRTDSLAPTITRFNQNVFGVGIAASLCSGMGLSFKHHLANIPIAYQVSAGAVKAGGIVLWDLGGEFQYDLSVASNRLYAVFGIGEYYYGKDSNQVGNRLVSPTRLGIGIGYEMSQSNAIGLSLNLMITLFEPDGVILPLPSIGLHYYFK
jgi:hypothetical protein